MFKYTGKIIDTNRLVGLVGRVFTNGPVDLVSIPSRIIPETLKMVLNTSWLNTQQYKVRIKGKVEQSREISSALPYTSVSSYWKGSLLSPSTTVAKFTFTYKKGVYNIFIDNLIISAPFYMYSIMLMTQSRTSQMLKL